MGSATPGPAAPAEGAAAGAGAPWSAGAAAPRQPWPERVLHAVIANAQARVWIRDAAFEYGDTAHVLARLAAELAQRGLALRELTINGRSAYEARAPQAFFVPVERTPDALD
jgi:hypothetical protein